MASLISGLARLVKKPALVWRTAAEWDTAAWNDAIWTDGSVEVPVKIWNGSSLGVGGVRGGHGSGSTPTDDGYTTSGARRLIGGRRTDDAGTMDVGVVILNVIGIGCAVYFLDLLIKGQQTHLGALLSVQRSQIN